MAGSYWLIPVQDGRANIYHYTSGRSGAPGAVYLGPTPTTAKIYGPSVAGSRGLILNPGIIEEQGAPSTLETIGAGTGFLGAGGAPTGILGDIIAAISRARGGSKATTETPPQDTKPNEPTPGGRTRPNTEPNTGPGAGLRLAGAGTTFGGVTDFFHFIAWLFHPLNWLRMVEFLTGIFLLYMGLSAASRVFRRAAGPTPLARRAIGATPLGRAARIRGYSRSYSERAAARERIST